MSMRLQGPLQWLGDAVGVVPELDTVVVVAELRVHMWGQGASVGWPWAAVRVRTRVIWLNIGDRVTTGAMQSACRR